MKKKTKKEVKEHKLKASAKKFNNELKKAIGTALMAAFGFLIALAWRDAITEYVSKITAASPIQGTLVSAIIITIISVIGILIITSFLKQE